MRKLRAKPSFTFTTSPSEPRFATFSIRITCMAAPSVQVGVVDQREEAGAIDGHAQLALVSGLGAGDARRDDLSVLVDEILEDRNVLVVDLLDLLGGEAAELAAAEQPAILVASVLAFGELAAFSFTASAGGWSGHGVSLGSRRRLGGLFPGRFNRCGAGGIGDVARLLFLHHRRRPGHGLGHLDGEVAQHGVVELERVLELGERLVADFDVHKHLMRLEHLLDRVGDLAPPPVLDAMHLAVAGGDRVAVALDHPGDLFALVRMNDENDLVMAQVESPYGFSSPLRSGAAIATLGDGARMESEPSPRV